MKANEAMKEIMNESGMSSGRMAKMLERPTSTISDRLRTENMGAETMAQMLGTMGYMLVMMPVESKMPKGGRKID